MSHTIYRLDCSNSHTLIPSLVSPIVNGRSKEICVRSLEPSSISQKVKLLLDSSGAKITQIRRPKVESTNESVRGIWSAFHEETR